MLNILTEVKQVSLLQFLTIHLIFYAELKLGSKINILKSHRFSGF